MKKFIDINEDLKEKYNALINHPLQSFEWGEFRKKTGVEVIRRALSETRTLSDAFSITVHKIPKSPFKIGYLPKGENPTQELISELEKIGRSKRCIFIQLEPNLEESKLKLKHQFIKPSAHPLFTKYTFVLDLKKSEEELLKNMHPKTRYNIRVAQKHNVEIIEDSSKKGFMEYMKLTEETTNRQRFYAHSNRYHEILWETLPKKIAKNTLSYHLFHAKYKDEKGKTFTLASWVLFVFKDTLYYPYGASSSLFREVMASNLLCWEVIKFGKKLGLTNFDMWGALGPEPDTHDPWYGFHRFKQGYGARLVEFAGSYDLILNPALYSGYKIADKIRWAALGLKKKI